MKKNIGIAIIVLGIISGLLFFYAGIKLFASGSELQKVESVSGTSIAEAYYQEMGRHGVAYSIIAFAFGFGVISISLGFGGRFLLENENISIESNESKKLIAG